MENDQVFASDAAISTAVPQSYNGGHRGHDATIAAYGGIEAYKDTDYEATPLLSGGVDDGYVGGATRPGDGEDRDPPGWSGERDFEGRPWWNKPTVRHVHGTASLALHDLLLMRSFAGVLVVTGFSNIHPRLRRHRCSQAQSYPRPHLRGISFG